MSKEKILELIARHSRQVIPELENHVFQPDDRLKDLGANSMDRAEIAMMAMESLSLQIPRIEVAGVKNIGELAEVLYEKLHAA